LDKYLVRCSKKDCVNYRSGICIMCFQKCPVGTAENMTKQKNKNPQMPQIEQLAINI